MRLLKQQGSDIASGGYVAQQRNDGEASLAAPAPNVGPRRARLCHCQTLLTGLLKPGQDCGLAFSESW